MKKLFLSIAAALTLFSCTDEITTLGVVNNTNGFYKVDMLSASTAGWAGGVNSSETFDNLCYLAFDNGMMYTLNMDSVITPIPTLGVNYETNFEFYTNENDTALSIGTEEWIILDNNGEINLTRVTNYQGMGMDIQTLILTEL